MIDCRTHQTAYVMNLTFFFGSNRLAASINPMFPSLIRSRKLRPHPRYFLAKLTTKRRLASTSFLRASRSPFRIFAPSFFSSSAVIRGSLDISWRYFLRLWELEPPPRCDRSCSSIVWSRPFRDAYRGRRQSLDSGREYYYILCRVAEESLAWRAPGILSCPPAAPRYHFRHVAGET